uniref:Phage protein n=1 Tax=Rhabditophanes sp. KR3021 TaxID=114890 RepID=A0AC35TSK0_9BILA
MIVLKSDLPNNTRIYLLHHPVTKEFTMLAEENVWTRRQKSFQDLKSVGVIYNLPKCPLANKYARHMSLKEDGMASDVDKGKAVEATYSKEIYDEQTALAMKHCIAESHPEFKNRLSTVMLLADEDTVNASGISFRNDLINDHEVYAIKKTFAQSEFNLIEADKFERIQLQNQ